MFVKNEDLLILASVGENVRRLITYTYPTGSRYTVTPPVTNTDIDFYAFINPDLYSSTMLARPQGWQLEDRLAQKAELLRAVGAMLEADGWSNCANEGDAARYSQGAGFGREFVAYRKDDYNLMLTVDTGFFYNAAAATELCRAMNIMDKQDRIRVHQMVHNSGRYHDMPNTERQRYFINYVLEEPAPCTHSPPSASSDLNF